MRVRVDLPAPFSPTRAWISPDFTSSRTLDKALTPGKLFETLDIVSIVPPVSFRARNRRRTVLDSRQTSIPASITMVWRGNLGQLPLCDTRRIYDCRNVQYTVLAYIFSNYGGKYALSQVNFLTVETLPRVKWPASTCCRHISRIHQKNLKRIFSLQIQFCYTCDEIHQTLCLI